MDVSRFQKRFLRQLVDHRLLAILAVILSLMTLYEPSFFAVDNLRNILSNSSINGILAVGMTMLMISRAFDISVGSIMVVSGVISVLLADRLGALGAILAAIGSGIVMGLINGILVAKLKVNSFIATLGTMVVFQGIAFVLTDTQPITTDSESFQRLAAWNVAGVPAPVIYFSLLFCAIWLVMDRTRLGKFAYAIGGNEDACRMLGIDVAFYRICFFVISGVCASFAGILLCSTLGAASGVFAENRAIVVIAAIVLGGVHLSGGAGNLGGVLQAVILLGILDNMTVYLRLVGYWEMFFRAIILIGVVVFDVLYIKWHTSSLQSQELLRVKAIHYVCTAEEGQ